MRFFRKREIADPFAAFSERYGVRLPKAELDEAPPEPEDEPPKDEPESAGPLWAHSTLGVGLGASQKEISAAYRILALLVAALNAGSGCEVDPESQNKTKASGLSATTLRGRTRSGSR